MGLSDTLRVSSGPMGLWIPAMDLIIYQSVLRTCCSQHHGDTRIGTICRLSVLENICRERRLVEAMRNWRRERSRRLDEKLFRWRFFSIVLPACNLNIYQGLKGTIYVVYVLLNC